MTTSLRIVAADDEATMLQYYGAVLPTLGHQLVARASNGRELIEACQQYDPDLVITDIDMPDVDGIEAVHKIYAEQPRPIMLISGHSDPKVFEAAVADQIVTGLVKPAAPSELRDAIEQVMRQFHEFELLCKEVPSTRQALRQRRIVERAKTILMLAPEVNEENAFSRLQAMARQHDRSIATTAQIIVSAADAASS